jgi:hypothetical protein
MNNIGPKCWPTWLQPSDDREIMISCQVCWRIRRWHNGRTRHSPNPEPGKVSQDCLTNGEESAAHSILAKSDLLPQRPYTFAQTNLVTSSLFACGDAADHTFRVARHPTRIARTVGKWSFCNHYAEECYSAFDPGCNNKHCGLGSATASLVTHIRRKS